MRRLIPRLMAAAFVTLGVLIPVPAHALDSPTDIVVQGGTTISDSGLWDNLIAPGFEAKYPQYTISFVAVGTGQAITNAEAGLGDAVWTHNPAAEQQFVSAGYSYEPYGRYTMASDFITVGAKSDPANVLGTAPHNAPAAFAAIAAAGENGEADFISRGDASGTNAKEKTIWGLSGVQLNLDGWPGPAGTHDFAPWYQISHQGQAGNLQETDDCPFTSGACYTLADRGTFDYLDSNGTITNLKLVSDRNDPPAAGGTSLLLNPYHAYAVNPDKFAPGHINLQGALDLLDYLTDPAVQAAIGQYPTAANPAFTPDARPDITILDGLPGGGTADANKSLTVDGTVVPNYYLDPPLTGSPVELHRADSPDALATTTVQSDGSFSFTFKPTVSDTYSVVWPQYQDRRETDESLGHMNVQSTVSLAISGVNGLKVSTTGKAAPLTDRVNAQVLVQAKKGNGAWQTFGSVNMSDGKKKYTKTITLPSGGTWHVRAKYQDPGVVLAGLSKEQRVSV
jgi:tungstate transport system substrate-binding protein